MTDVFLPIVGAGTFFVVAVVVARAVAAIEVDAFGDGRNHLFVGVEPPTRFDEKGIHIQ